MEDPHHYGGLCLIDGSGASLLALRHGNDVVAVAHAAGGGAGQDTPTQAPARLHRQIGQLGGVDDGLDADVPLFDLAFREGEDDRLLIAGPLVERG